MSRPNPECDWSITPVPDLRIIPQDLWNAAKERQGALKLQSSEDKPWDRHRPSYLLSKLLTCGCCGGGMSKMSQFDFRSEAIDAAIHFGQPDWPNCEFQHLRGEVVVPACSPAFKAEHQWTGVADLSRAPLLHLMSRPDAWEQFFAKHEIQTPSLEGMLFDQFATAAQAAMAGLGVALLPEFLIQDELANGSLVEAFDARMQSRAEYYLCWPSQNSGYGPLIAFRRWLEGRGGT